MGSVIHESSVSQRLNTAADMESPHVAAILLVILATHQGLASAPKGAASQVVEEINRRMGLYTKTKYVKAGEIEEDYYRVIEDPPTYSYEYDCTGHVWHVLWKSSLQAYEDAMDAMDCCETGSGVNPSTKTWITFMKDLAEEGTIGNWQAVTEVTDLRPGDILIRDSTDPGHAMIAMGTPESTGDPGKYRLWISDSTSDPHQSCEDYDNDPRDTNPEKGETGMGTGYIRVEDGMMMDWCICCSAHYKPLLAGRPLA